MSTKPSASPGTGTFPDNQLITISQYENLDTYYTLDGTNPFADGYYSVDLTKIGSGGFRDICTGPNNTLYGVTYFSNRILKSTDEGLTWIGLSGAGDYPWMCIKVNKNGVIVVAADPTNPIAKYSIDGGVTWVTISAWTCVKEYHTLDVFDDGTFIVAEGIDKRVYTSPDGITWTLRTTLSSLALTVSTNSSNAMITLSTSTNVIYKTTNYGVNWTTFNMSSSDYWYVCLGASGRTYMAPSGSYYTGYYSDNLGTTWTSAPGIKGLAIRSKMVEIDNVLYGLSGGSYAVYISLDKGVTLNYTIDMTLSNSLSIQHPPDSGTIINGKLIIGGNNIVSTIKLLPPVGIKYTNPFTITSDCTLKAIAYASPMFTTNYYINRKPYAIPVGGEYQGKVDVELKQEKNLKIYYTLDGSEPSGSPYPFGSKGTFTDPRDNKVYRTVFMPDGNWWSIDNLAYAGNSNLIMSTNSNGITYGYNYRWISNSTNIATATNSEIPIPPNTHLPSIYEWNALFSSINNDGSILRLNNSTIWPNFPGTDDYGFSATPNSGSYQGSYWSSTKYSTYAACMAKFTSYDNTVSASDSSYSYPNTEGQVRFIVDANNVTSAIGIVGTEYTGPISVNVNTVIKAASPYSYVMTENYIITELRKLFVGINGEWKQVVSSYFGENNVWENINISIGNNGNWK